MKSISREAKARYKYNTYSLKLNTLKILAILFRLLPLTIRNWGYKKLK